MKCARCGKEGATKCCGCPSEDMLCDECDEKMRTVRNMVEDVESQQGFERPKWDMRYNER